MKTTNAFAFLSLATFCVSVVYAKPFGSGANAFDIEFVLIGNPGNGADTAGNTSPAGKLDYVYRIGKYEISRKMIEKANNEGGLGITLPAQRRTPSGEVVWERLRLEPRATAVVIVDMWDHHWCRTYTKRVANLVPRMNKTLNAARKLGITIVHAPSDVVDFYNDSPQRKAMQAIPPHSVPAKIDFNPPPAPKGDNCECGPDRPCKVRRAWSRQHADLAIGPDDLIGDCCNGRELLNLCVDRGIKRLIYVGVASNMCVCYRSMGMINMRRHGLQVLFVADLVEAITANGVDPVTRSPDANFTPAKGTAVVQRFLERHVAASIESRQLLRAVTPAADDRPHVVFVMAEQEYGSERTLPAFAKRYLANGFRCTFLQARANQGPGRNDVRGLDALLNADLLVLSMRQRALPVTQMDFLERYIRAGKPLVALRVSIVPFQVNPSDRPDGHVRWQDFDRQVLGCHYRGYPSESRSTGCDVWVVDGARDHPILRGLRETRFHSPSWLYNLHPLAESTTVLMRGSWKTGEPEQPVAFTNTHEGARVFYTSLGHAEDFQNQSFLRMIRNAIDWALERPVVGSNDEAGN